MKPLESNAGTTCSKMCKKTNSTLQRILNTMISLGSSPFDGKGMIECRNVSIIGILKG